MPPEGILTFLLTDIEGSTSMWGRHPAEMRAALLRHDTILTEAIENAGGHIVRMFWGSAFRTFSTWCGSL